MTTNTNLDDLVTQVSQLTTATTDLLNATNVGKASLDQAVTDAESAANTASDAANTASDAASGADDAVQLAQTAATEAKAAEDNATAIVHNDEGSVTPKAGAYPVADSKGQLDIGWMPLLQAMYPYSGVMGDIGKETSLFFAGAHPSYSNRIDIRSTAQPHNINGRFVKPKNGAIMLPEAESTGDRAIAFDDIFLDWNGTITTYRSITPHRTTTGYDRDAIATEHGYTKVNTGLYKTGETYALLLGRVARRNMGAYHPVFNPEGAVHHAWKDSVLGTQLWFGGSVHTKPTSLESCFSQPVKTTFANSGSIAGISARPDKKPYDAIYADDFTPLYYSAKNVIDRQALLFDSFNRAVAGETFSGAEGTVSSSILTLNDDYRSRFTATEYVTVSESSITFEAIVQYQACTFSAGKGYMNFSLLEPATFYFSASVSRLRRGTPTWRIDYTDKDGEKHFPESGRMTSEGSFSGSITIPAGGTITRFYIQDISSDIAGCDAIIENCIVYSDMPHLTDSARPQFLMVDIIGALDAWPDEWKTEGLPGNWLSVGEEGESLIPDKTPKNFKLSRKCFECYQVLVTNDKGVSWKDWTSDWKQNLESPGNSKPDDPVPADVVVIIFYRTSANPFELSSNAYTATMDKTIGKYGHFSPEHGSVLGSNLINKVPSVNYSYLLETLSLIRIGLERRGSRTNLSGNSGDTEHAPAQKQKIEGPVFKTLNYLSVDGFLHILYKEIKWGSNGVIGDNNMMNIVSKQSTATDLNGETVIVGQKRVELPYHFDGEQY